MQKQTGQCCSLMRTLLTQAYDLLSSLCLICCIVSTVFIVYRCHIQSRVLCEFALSFLQDCPLLCVKEGSEKIEHPPGSSVVLDALKIANSKAREAASKGKNEVS